jgi:hypothetical protein
MKAETCKILTNGKGIIHEQSSKETADVDCNAKKNPVGKKRLPPFTYPPLPEIKICYAITIATMAYAWYCVFIASQKWIALVDKSVLPMSKLPFFGHRFKDESNWEWFRWSPFAMQYLPSMLLHSLVFNTFDRFLPENIWIPLYILISMMISAYLFTFKLLACSLVQGLFIFACTFQFRFEMLSYKLLLFKF